MPSASARVLGTYELLEQILRHLSATDDYDLFVLQRVNTNWQGVIARSESLRKKMFLLADGPVMHPSSYSDQHKPEYNSTARRNPFLRASYKDLYFNELSVPFEGTGLLRFSTTPTAREKDQSRRDCLLTQPPITVTAVCGPCKHYSCLVYNPRGITIGDLCDVDKRLMKSAERYSGYGPLGKYTFFNAEISLTWCVWPGGGFS